MYVVTPAIGCTPMAQEITFLLISARMRPPIGAISWLVKAMIDKKRGVKANCANVQKAREVTAQRRAAEAAGPIEIAAEAEAQADAGADEADAQLHQLQADLQPRELQLAHNQRMQQLHERQRKEQQLADLVAQQRAALLQCEHQLTERQHQLQQQQVDLSRREQDLTERQHQLQQQQADLNSREQQARIQTLAQQLHSLQQELRWLKCNARLSATITPSQTMVGVRARHFVIDDRVLRGLLADLGQDTLTRARFEADSLPHWQRFIQYSQLQNSGWEFARRVETDGVSVSVHFVRSQAVHEPVELPFIGRELTATSDYSPATHIAVGVDPGVTQAIKAAHAMRDPATGQVLRQWEWELTKGQLKHDSGLTKAKQDTARWSAAIQPQLQQLAAATPAGTTLDGLHAHILALKATWDPLWEEYLKPRWRRQRLALHHAQERVIEGFCKKVVNGMKWVSRQHYHQERGVAVYLGAGNFSQGGWKAGAVRAGFRKVVEQPSRPSTDPRPDRLVIVDEFRTSRVSSSVHARQPCELHLPANQPRPADWVPPAGQVNHRLLRPAWSLRHAKCVRGLKWCHEVPPNPPPPPPAPLAQDPPAPAQPPPLGQDPPPAPAQDPPPAPAQAQPPPPAQAQPPPAAQPPPPAQAQQRPQAPPWGRWLDRDTNPCLNFQRIGESKQRPLELCSWKELEALPPIGKEYHQRYKPVNDRLPKVRQRLHRAAEYRRGIDGRARNNA
ncbi:hypothetical protein QJQ45_026814 [Haematococcus lacustris]|nr:hypothetical protein QJQ45_026814 [Haematococcus lacustris]